MPTKKKVTKPAKPAVKKTAKSTKKFIAAWDDSYGNPKPTTYGLSWFTEKVGYDKDDRSEIAKLKIGEWALLDQGSHLVLRIS